MEQHQKNHEVAAHKPLTSPHLEQEDQAQQFISSLLKLFPDARLQLFLHASKKSYKQYIKNHDMEYAHILYAVDIQEITEGMHAYHQLCAQMLHAKPNSYNIWLAKEIDFTADLRQIKLGPSTIKTPYGDARQIVFTLRKIEMYCKD